MINEPQTESDTAAEASEPEAAPAPAKAAKAAKKPGPKPGAKKAAKAPKPAAAPKAPKRAPEAEVAPQGTALFDHEDKGASASFNGVELARGKNGLILAPLAAIEDLQAHGFVLVGAGK